MQQQIEENKLMHEDLEMFNQEIRKYTGNFEEEKVSTKIKVSKPEQRLEGKKRREISS